MKRRKFLKTTAASVPMLSVFPAGLASISREKKSGKIEKRSLGKTGEKLSIIGFGGIVVMDATEKEAADRVARAIDYGVNYFDVAPTYGNAEEMLGPALELYRKDVFLACKTMERTRDGARKELETSLKKMRTDHFDLYQHHAVTKMEDVDRIFSKDGAIQTFLKAREEGLVKYLGFSAHSEKAALVLMERFDFDTILFPVNFSCWYAGDFGPRALEMAKQKEMGILALKAMAERGYEKGEEHPVKKGWYMPLMDEEESRKGLRFTLSHPVTAAIPPGDENLFSRALRHAVDFKEMDPEEVVEMKKKGLATKPLFSSAS